MSPDPAEAGSPAHQQPLFPSAASALEFLKIKYPEGFHVGRTGKLTVAGESEKITDLGRLSELAMGTKTFQFDVNGTLVDLVIKGLEGEKEQLCDALLAEVQPPKKYKVEGGKKSEDGFDYYDKDFMVERAGQLRKKRALAISMGLVDIVVPGANVDEIQKWLESRFTPKILDALFAAISSLTSDPIDKASFI